MHGMKLLRIRLNDRCIPEFFWYSRSAEYKAHAIRRINMAVNQVSINQKQIKAIPIYLPINKEQKEIVSLLDSLIEKEKQAKETAEQVVDQIDALKKSIFARVFRGELGKIMPPTDAWRNC